MPFAKGGATSLSRRSHTLHRGLVQHKALFVHARCSKVIDGSHLALATMGPRRPAADQDQPPTFICDDGSTFTLLVRGERERAISFAGLPNTFNDHAQTARLH